MMRIGIFGGSFNPPHMGHINSLQSVLKKTGLDRIHVIPSYQNPLKAEVAGASPEQRFEMIRLALETYGEAFIADDCEIKRGGPSYSIETVEALQARYPGSQLHLILGADHLESFNQWKDYKKILQKVDVIFTTRPGYSVPSSIEDCPNYLKELVIESDFNFLELETGKAIQFLKLDDVDISASKVRKMLRAGRPMQKYLPLAVENFIKENNLYRPIGEKIADYKEFTEFCGNILFSKKAIAVRGFDLRQCSHTTEFSLIASGTSTRHTASLAETVLQQVREEFQVLPQGIEGLDEGRWVVLDYGSLMIHLFYDFVRQEYNLENLWKEGVDLKIVDTSA